MNTNNNLVVVGLLSGIAGLLIGFMSAGGGSHRGYGMMMDRGDYRSGYVQNQQVDEDQRQGAGMGMHGAMGGMMTGLQGLSGDALDKAFLSEMIVHHQGAVQMAQTLLAGTKRPELIKMANDIIKAQSAEITQMKTWQTNWFGQ